MGMAEDQRSVFWAFFFLNKSQMRNQMKTGASVNKTVSVLNLRTQLVERQILSVEVQGVQTLKRQTGSEDVSHLSSATLNPTGVSQCLRL